MGALTQFLIQNTLDVEVQKEVKIDGFDLPFQIKTISESRNKELENQATTATPTRSRGVIKQTDHSYHNELLVVECTVDPNFKDAELQEKYGVARATDLVRKILRPGQYQMLLLEILEFNGFVEDDFNEKKEEAKNS